MHPIFRTFALICLLTAVYGSVAAQVPAPEKEIIIIDLFARNRTVPAPYMEIIRQQVVAAFDHRGRFRLIDAESSRALTPPVSSEFIDPTNAAAVQADFMRERIATMNDMGARYVVTGAVSDYKFEHVALPSGDKRPPIPGFRATFTVTLSAYDLKLQKALSDRTYILKGDAPIAEDADKAAMTTLTGSLTFYIDNNFHFETVILQLCPPEGRKNSVKELYIHSGSDMGVTEDDTFNVYEDVPIGGVMTRQLVGHIRVNNVQNPTVTKCKITKGSDEIVDAFMSGRGLVCVSDTKALFY